MLLNIKMELHNTPTSKLAEIKTIYQLSLNRDNKYTANDICSGQLFQQIVGIPMGTNCAPLLADLFLYPMRTSF